MSGKTYALMFIGIILGGCVGYATSLVYIPVAVDAYFPTNYRARFDGLTEMYQDLSGMYDVAVSEIAGLGEDVEGMQAAIDELQGQYDVLDEAHQELDEANTALTQEHEALTEAHLDALESYDSLLMQYMIITGTAPITPETQPEDTIRKDFAWEYGGETYALSLYIPQGLYDYYSNRTRVPTEDYSVYVTHPHDDDYLSTIIAEFDGIAAEEGYGETEIVSLVVAFVQSLPYTTDDVTTDFDEYPRYPIETLVDGGGDCEDSSILTSALLDGMGYDCVLINPPGHVGVGVALDHSGTYWPYEGVDYYYVETTGEGWEIGELPEDYQGQGANVYPILPVPIVTIEWTGSKVNHRVTLVIDVQNVGTGEAENIKVFFAHEGEEGEIWDPVESSFFDLSVGEEKAVALETDEPQGVRTRIVVRVLDAYGVIMEESHSVWFDTS